MESKLCERWESFLNVWVLKCLFKWIFLEVMGNKHTAGRLTIRFWVKASCSLCRALFQLFTVKWWDNWETKYYGDPIVCQCELAVPSKNDISFWPFAKSSCSICFCCSYELLDFRCTLNSMVKLSNMHFLFKISMLIK